MPPPNDAAHCFAAGISMSRILGGIVPSPGLVDLLAHARGAYDWPSGTGAAASQATIIALEATVSGLLVGLTPAAAHQIVLDVSSWAGNNTNSQARLAAATHAEILAMQTALTALLNPATARLGLNTLSALPGLSPYLYTQLIEHVSPIS